MTASLETSMCECGECLALRAAADAPGSGETIAAFEHDHLGIGSASQWGVFQRLVVLGERVPRPEAKTG